LKYQYAGTPQGSAPALHLRLNGKDIDSVRLKPTSSPVESSEIFRLPTGSLQAYANTLTVDFYFERDAPANSVRPSFAIHRNSSLDLRGIPHSVVLPRLELFADAGYPFTKWPDLSRTAIILPNAPARAEYETLLNMAGFFGAQTGALTSQLTIAVAGDLDHLQNKDLILIGTPDSLPLLSSWAGEMPLALSGSRTQVNQGTPLNLLLHAAWPFRQNDGGRLRHLLGSGANLDILVESFVSPLRPDRLVVAIIPTSSHPIDALRALFTPSERQGPVYGGVAIARNQRFESYLVGTLAYRAGEFNRQQHIMVFLIENYWLLPLLVLLLAVLIVVWVRWSTERVVARRLASWESD
jgi:cellulose synthase (UDP-forming)